MRVPSCACMCISPGRGGGVDPSYLEEDFQETRGVGKEG